MGLLSRIAARVKSGVKAVSREAKHPGKPPSYLEHDSPFYPAPSRDDRAGGAVASPAPASPPKGATSTGAAGGAPRADRGEEKPWFLDGQQDGWDDTNPGGDKGAG